MNKPRKYKSGPDFSFFSFSGFSIKKQTFFAKRLSFLIRAGVPMLESMHVIKQQAKSKSDIKIFSKIISDVANGQSLAASLSRFEGVFGNFTVNIIKAGESSGTLVQNLSYLADELKKKGILRKKIISSMVYPIIITIATFGIVGLLIVYIFPKILPIFQSLNTELPLATRLVIFLSAVIRDYGLYIMLFLLVFVVTFWIARKKIDKVKLFYDRWLLKIPLFGAIARHYNLTNVCRSAGLLLKSGVSLTETIIVTADTTDNLAYKSALEHIARGIIRGKNISDLVMAHSDIFPEMFAHMVGVGEKSGNLSNTFIYLSEYYENEFDDLTKNLSSALEPTLMIMMGILVGFVAISVITPIYEITNTLQR
jgi:type IV pilus assembly protein PilC